MFKFAIVVCASIFVASTLVESGETLNGKEVQLRAHNARKSIEDRLHRVRNEIYSLGPQPSEINYEIVENLKENVTKHMDEVRSLTLRNMQVQEADHKKPECLSHYDQYETLATSVLEKLDNCVNNVALATFESFGKLMTEANEGVKRIEGIEDWAPQCEGFWCKVANTTVESVTRNILQSLEEALDDYKRLVDGSSVREAVHTKTDYDRLIESEDRYWNELLICVTRKNSSSTPDGA